MCLHHFCFANRKNNRNVAHFFSWLVICFAIFFYRTTVFQLPEHQVQVLHLVEKLRPGDEVYAVYPDTTSFYPATIVQAPRRQGGGAGGSGSGSSGGGATQFCMVHFVDDSDEFGVTHDKAVPLAHVMLPP